MTKRNNPLERLRHHVTGAVERGEAQAIAAVPALHVVTPVPTEFTQDDFLGMDWRDKAYWASRGQLRAILVNALGIEPQAGEPAFLGRPSYTSDGFAMCNFRTAEGEHHMGAFVGASWQIRRNIEGLADHRLSHKLLFTPEERAAYLAATNWWCGR